MGGLSSHQFWGSPHPTVLGKHCSIPSRTASITLSVHPEPGSLPDLWCQFICIFPQILAGLEGACDLLSPWVLKTSVSPCCTLCRLFFCNLYLIFNASHLAYLFCPGNSTVPALEPGDWDRAAVLGVIRSRLVLMQECPLLVSWLHNPPGVWPQGLFKARPWRPKRAFSGTIDSLAWRASWDNGNPWKRRLTPDFGHLLWCFPGELKIVLLILKFKMSGVHF